MKYRYNTIEKLIRKIYRKFNPIPGSPYTKGYVKDICEINLVPRNILQSFFKEKITLLKNIKGDEIGDYLEFGVFNGSSIGSAYLAAKEVNATDMKFYGFDSFQGLPTGTSDTNDILQDGFYRCSFEDTQSCLRKRGIDPDDIYWIKGWYNETLTDETIETYKIGNIGIVFVDCDTYASAKLVLDFIAPLITNPCIICFDDWKLYDLDLKNDGEYRAFNEFLDTYKHIKARELKSYNRKSKTFLLTPKVTEDSISL